MLGRIVFVLIILGVILAGAFAMNFLVEEPGTITLDYGDRIYELSLFPAAILLVGIILAIMLAVTAVRFLIALLRFIAGDTDALGGFWTKRRQRAGLQALSTSMVAMAAGDTATATKKAKLAERKLMQPNLTRLINAQAAEMAGDTSRAETYFKALMAEPATAFVGAQGLLGHAMADGDTDRALRLAAHAKELKPKDQGTLETLYSLQSPEVRLGGGAPDPD